MTDTSNASRMILFDADAEQRVELTIHYRGTERTVAHRFAALTDEQFFEYEARKKVRVEVSGQELLIVRNDDQELAAAEWLWNELATGREGYVPRDDWRERTNIFDKAQAIAEGLLAVRAVRPLSAAADSEAGELVDDDLGTDIELDCLFSSGAMTTRHCFRAPSAADAKAFDRLLRLAENVVARGGRRAAPAQVVIPSKARELAALYDRLIVETHGYGSRVPAHHKREAVLELFSREARVTEKVAALAPAIARRVSAGSTSFNECPGESVCERFRTSAGADPAEKAANACTGCELLPTKPGLGTDGERTATLTAIERIRRERDSGAGLDLSEFSPGVWQLIQLWDQLETNELRRASRGLHDLLRGILTGQN